MNYGLKSMRNSGERVEKRGEGGEGDKSDGLVLVKIQSFDQMS